VSSTIRDVGDAVLKYEDHREISEGAAKGAQQISELNDQWNTTLKGGKDADGNTIPPADPNDPSTAAKFRDTVLEPALDKFKSGFNTERSQQWAEHFVDQYRQHMFEKTAADMSTMAGIAVKVNYEKTKNLLSSAVASDPSSLDFALKSVDHSVGAMADSSPNLDLEAVQKKYGEYVNGAEMKMFQKAAQTQAKVDAYHDKSAAIAQRQLDDLNVHKSATDTMTKNVSVDPTTGQPIVNPKFFNDALEIARKNPDAPSAAATVRTMLDWGQSQLNKENKPVDDPVVKSDLMTRMFSADKPTTTLDLMRARADGKISDHTFQAYDGLVKELAETPLKGPVWQDTVSAVKGELVLSNVGMPGKDITGEGNYAKWAQTFIPQYLAKSRDRTLPPNALDVKDPTSLISQSMAPFKRTVSQRANDYISSLGGMTAAPTRTFGGVPVPAALNGIASLQRNPANGQWRDETSGTTYDKNGREIGK
jgi:hypothetical protein